MLLQRLHRGIALGISDALWHMVGDGHDFQYAVAGWSPSPWGGGGTHQEVGTAMKNMIAMIQMTAPTMNRMPVMMPMM